jgi:hypothetical protein
MISPQLTKIIASTLLITTGSITLLFAQEAHGSLPNPLDLTKLDCRTLLQMNGDERNLTLAFYHGLISGKNDEMVIERTNLSQVTDNVIDYCIDHPQDTIISVFKRYRPAPSF